jgi:hypothetical protein
MTGSAPVCDLLAKNRQAMPLAKWFGDVLLKAGNDDL